MLGVIYSDIGTSPLYVLNGIWPSSGGAPSKEDVIGGVSAIIWSLTLLPLLKYVRAHDAPEKMVLIILSFSLSFHSSLEPKKVRLKSRRSSTCLLMFAIGEGGSFALYQGIYPRAEKDHDADRTLTGESVSSYGAMKKNSLKSKIQFPLLLWVRPRIGRSIMPSHSLPSSVSLERRRPRLPTPSLPC